MAEERIITIRINGFVTKLSIPAESEEVYRKAAKMLNDRIAVYNQEFNLPYPDNEYVFKTLLHLFQSGNIFSRVL